MEQARESTLTADPRGPEHRPGIGDKEVRGQEQTRKEGGFLGEWDMGHRACLLSSVSKYSFSFTLSPPRPPVSQKDQLPQLDIPYP